MQGAFDKLAEIRATLPQSSPVRLHEDEFLKAADLTAQGPKAAENRLRVVLAEIGEMQRENQWQQILDLFFPVEEKVPDLCDAGLDGPVREKAAFALGQLSRFDEAIAQLVICAARDPENFHIHSALSYTAYNSLFAGKNREIFLSGKAREERIGLAHTHFEKACQLRPEGVTNFYRRGMLLHKIEDKPKKALPLFERAAANWENLNAEEKDRRRQEHKNYVKALYQMAGIELEQSGPQKAAETLNHCLAEDEKSNYLSRVHKYFALGKIEYSSGRFKEAEQALLFAERCRTKESIDFVYELLARVYLELKTPDKALAVINRVPEKFRKPYFRWTEADVFCALDRFDQARAVLTDCNERDRRSRHKGLLRLCKIEYLLGHDDKVADYAEAADRFFREKWINPCGEALFWLSACRLRAGDHNAAQKAACELRDHQPGYPKLDQLLKRINGQGDANGSQG